MEEISVISLRLRKSSRKQQCNSFLKMFSRKLYLLKSPQGNISIPPTNFPLKLQDLIYPFPSKGPVRFYELLQLLLHELLSFNRTEESLPCTLQIKLLRTFLLSKMKLFKDGALFLVG